ncbi:Endothelin-converting enzyme 2 [Balamuthia mandrillaris]
MEEQRAAQSSTEEKKGTPAPPLQPTKNTDYATKEYWEKRYQRSPSELYDWFKTWEVLKPTLCDALGPSDDILHLGCGNSSLSEDMYKEGYKKITNVDFSSVVIQQMKERYEATMPEMQWHVMDVLDMSYPDASFDVAIDKGTMDALMCENSETWELDPKLAEQCHKMCSEVSRVLRSGGRYIQITFGQPHFRKRVLQRPEYGWTLEVKTIEAFHYFVYIMTKS